MWRPAVKSDVIEKMRRLFRWKVRLIVTHRRRSKGGFNVTGPDGKLHWAPTFEEARNNLKVRMMCHDVQPWKIEVAKGPPTNAPTPSG